MQLRMTRTRSCSTGRYLPRRGSNADPRGKAAFVRMQSEPSDMRYQLLHLLKMMEKPGISVSVLPTRDLA